MLYRAARQRPVQASSFSLIVGVPRPTRSAVASAPIAHELNAEAPVRIRTVEGALDEALGRRRFGCGRSKPSAPSLRAPHLWRLRPSSVHGLATRPRDRDSHGSGRRGWRSRRPHRHRRPEAHSHRGRRRRGDDSGVVESCREPTLRREASDSAGLLAAMMRTQGTAMAASYLPARRVLRVAPSECMRDH